MVEWLYKSMLGIKVKGENLFEISPVIGDGVEFAKGSYNSMYGSVSSEWKKENDKVVFDITIPVNTKATFAYNDVYKELQPGKYHFVI